MSGKAKPKPASRQANTGRGKHAESENVCSIVPKSNTDLENGIVRNTTSEATGNNSQESTGASANKQGLKAAANRWFKCSFCQDEFSEINECPDCGDGVEGALCDPCDSQKHRTKPEHKRLKLVWTEPELAEVRHAYKCAFCEEDAVEVHQCEDSEDEVEGAMCNVCDGLRHRPKPGHKRTKLVWTEPEPEPEVVVNGEAMEVGAYKCAFCGDYVPEVNQCEDCGDAAGDALCGECDCRRHRSKSEHRRVKLVWMESVEADPLSICDFCGSEVTEIYRCDECDSNLALCQDCDSRKHASKTGHSRSLATAIRVEPRDTAASHRGEALGTFKNILLAGSLLRAKISPATFLTSSDKVVNLQIVRDAFATDLDADSCPLVKLLPFVKDALHDPSQLAEGSHKKLL